MFWEWFPKRLVGDTDCLGVDNDGDADNLLRGRYDCGGCGQALAVFAAGLVGVGGGIFACNCWHLVRGVGRESAVGDEWEVNFKREVCPESSAPGPGTLPRVFYWGRGGRCVI